MEAAQFIKIPISARVLVVQQGETATNVSFGAVQFIKKALSACALVEQRGETGTNVSFGAV